MVLLSLDLHVYGCLLLWLRCLGQKPFASSSSAATEEVEKQNLRLRKVGGYLYDVDPTLFHESFVLAWLNEKSLPQHCHMHAFCDQERVATNITIQPSRLNEKDVVIGMRVKLLRLLRLDPKDFKEFPLTGYGLKKSKSKSKSSAGGGGGSSKTSSKRKSSTASSTQGSQSSPPKKKASKSLATVPPSVKAKTSGFRQKARDHLRKVCVCVCVCVSSSSKCFRAGQIDTLVYAAS